MITPEIFTVAISREDAELKAAFDSKDGSYDNLKGELTYIVNHARGKAYRLVHDGIKVRTIVVGRDDNTTSTMSTIEEFETKQEVIARIEELKLAFDPEMIEAVDGNL